MCLNVDEVDNKTIGRQLNDKKELRLMTIYMIVDKLAQ